MYGRLICVLYLLQTGQHQADCIKPHQAHQKFSPRHSYLLIILSLPSQVGTYGDTGFNSGKCSHFNTGQQRFNKNHILIFSKCKCFHIKINNVGTSKTTHTPSRVAALEPCIKAGIVVKHIFTQQVFHFKNIDTIRNPVNAE